MNKGDVVKLKQNVIRMVVEKINSYSDSTGVRCVWFDTNNNLCRETFDAELLEVIE